ncbi:MAG: DUF222 domain-containing protein [Candidatus Nanopelagicales bacterium]
MIGWCQARQLLAFQQLFEQAEVGADPDGVVVDPTSPEVACAREVGPGGGLGDGGCGGGCGHRPARGAGRAVGGLVDLGKVREISQGTCELGPGDRQDVAARAVVYARTHTRRQVRLWLVREVDRIDPEAGERRRRSARKARGVWLVPECDGMATLSALLSAEEATACMESIRAASGSGAAGQADVLVAMVTGTTPAQPVPVTVIMTGEGAQIVGYGPIADGHAGQLLARLTSPSALIRLDRPGLRVGYAPSAAIRRYVQARDRHCRFPGCGRPARACDLDHLVPWPAGGTHVDNLICLCRTHHRMKTHTRWRVRALAGMTLEWTSPTGRKYLTVLDDP